MLEFPSNLTEYQSEHACEKTTKGREITIKRSRKNSPWSSHSAKNGLYSHHPVRKNLEIHEAWSIALFMGTSYS